MPSKKYHVELAKRADAMLLWHTEFLARVSPKAAGKLLAEFIKAISELSSNPYRFPFADDIDAPGLPPMTYRKCYFYERYKAIFLIEDNDVFIDAIVDCRQENNNLYP